jgi:septum formation protein
VQPCLPLILASASPRRRELLTSLGLDFTVLPSSVDEASIPIDGLTPAQTVEKLARVKAEAVAELYPDRLVIGADTVVVQNDVIYGKPVDAADAVRLLGLLQGQAHQVFTGVAVVAGARCVTAIETTQVWMRPLSEAERQAYVATGEPMDKAGAYAIQGAGSVLIPRIEGCYFNVVGLPLHRLSMLLTTVDSV